MTRNSLNDIKRMAQHQYYCEECGKHLFDSEKDGGAAGFEAQQKGFVYKMPFLFGIMGRHFFCSKDCWNKWLNSHTTEQERADGNRSAREIRQRMEADKPKLIEGLQRIQRAFELAKKRRKA